MHTRVGFNSSFHTSPFWELHLLDIQLSCAHLEKGQAIRSCDPEQTKFWPSFLFVLLRIPVCWEQETRIEHSLPLRPWGLPAQPSYRWAQHSYHPGTWSTYTSKDPKHICVVAGKLTELGAWLWSQNLEVQFPTEPPERKASLYGLGQAAPFQCAPEEGNDKPLLNTLYLENPGKGCHRLEST